MSWLRPSPLRQSLTRSGYSAPLNEVFGQQPSVLSSALRQRPLDTASDCDPRACYDSFCKHWQQAYDIIKRSELSCKHPNHDDVLAVVSHLDFMVTLLLVELHYCNKITLPPVNESDATPHAPCLEFMLSESLLDKLYEWGIRTGRYANAVRLEQLKLYELLVSHSRHQLLCHEPFLRPLLKILASSQGEIYPADIEKRLVILLNQLCVLLMQNVHLLDLFFFSAEQEQNKQQNAAAKLDATCVTNSTNFIIFSLLIPYVHREGSVGHQARDALLLCMALSQKNDNVGTYIAQYSSMCPLLVTGLGGLYSRLPNSIEVGSNDWHRITPDDVTDIPELTAFMNALEFCNAVVQVAHDLIKHQLLDFMYQGFIVPVLGPAILQTLKDKHFQTNIDSQISAMSYLDLILRSVTEPDLMRAFVKFLLDNEKFDGERLIDTLVERLKSADSHLCIVTLALFDTLLGLYCEDLMLELLLKYLLPGKHVPISYRHKINKVDVNSNAADFFLDLSPDAMKRARELTKHKHVAETIGSSQNNKSQVIAATPLPSPTSSMSKTIGANWNYYGINTGDSLYSNYYAYIFEAHHKIEHCRKACAKWNNKYRFQKWPTKQSRTNSTQIADMIRDFFAENSDTAMATNVTSPDALPAALTNTPATSDAQLFSNTISAEKKESKFDSLPSIGESSGYESFKWRPCEEDEDAEVAATQTATVPLLPEEAEENRAEQRAEEHWRISNSPNDLIFSDLDFSEDLFAKGTVTLGPFLNAIWSKLQTFTSNSLYVNLHLTGLITHLARYPLPLVYSILLRPDIIITSDTPSFHQVLRILKQQIDAELPVIEDSLEIIDVARSYLIDREFRLINARKNEPKSSNRNPKTAQQQRSNQQSSCAPLSFVAPVQVTPSSLYDPFKRNDTKRKSIGRSITSIFSRKPNSSNFGSSGISTTATASSAHSTLQERSLTRETSLSTKPNKTERLPNEQSLSTNATVSLFSSPTVPVGGSTVAAGTLVGFSSGNTEPVSLDSISSMGAIANSSGTERTRDLALCAVLLDEWLKELAAVAQEQTLVLINDNI